MAKPGEKELQYRYMKRHKKKQESLATTLPGIIQDKGWEKQVDLYSLFSKWDQIVDKVTAEHARPLKIVRGVFWVEVDTSSWIHQLQFEKLHILEKLNAELEFSKLQDVKFTIAAKTKAPDNQTSKKVSFSPVDPMELSAFENQAGFIEDEESRKALIRIWYLFKACRTE